MGSVFLQQLSYGCESLESMIRRLNKEIQGLSDVISTLCTFSNMEDMIRRLNKEKQELERQKRILCDMAIALDRIIISYKRTEKKIIDHTEGSGNRNRVIIQPNVDLFSQVSDKIPIKTG